MSEPESSDISGEVGSFFRVTKRLSIYLYALRFDRASQKNTLTQHCPIANSTIALDFEILGCNYERVDLRIGQVTLGGSLLPHLYKIFCLPQFFQCKDRAAAYGPIRRPMRRDPTQFQ